MNVNVQATASCITVTGLPPIVTVPVRDRFEVFAATLKETVELPVPVSLRTG